MFNANNARNAITAAIEAESDLFAAELEDRFENLSLTDQQALMRRLREVVADKANTAALVAGTYAQNSSGQPAAQLGAPATDPRKKLVDALSALSVSQGQGQAILRIVSQPTDPGHIDVQPDGTPVELAAVRQERDAQKRRAETAEAQLERERDDTKSGSLAKLLADMTAERDALQSAGAHYDRNAAIAAARSVEKAIEDQRGRMGGAVDGRDAALARLNELAKAVKLIQPTP